MSTEEKNTSNPKTAESTKPKRHFKFDKNHIQGFIAGILLCAIAFTGLYYGTDGQFFSGNMSYTPPLVTDATFENVVLKSSGILLVVSSSDYDLMDFKFLLTDKEFKDKVKMVILDEDNSSKTMQDYHMWVNPRVLAFKNGKYIYYRDFPKLLWWIMEN